MHSNGHADYGSIPESWIAEDLAVSHGTVKQEMSDVELSQSEYIKLGVQCSIVVMIAGIVAWLLAAYPY